MKRKLLYLLLTASPLLSSAQQTDSVKTFTLGEVVVTSEKDKPLNSTIDAQKLQNFYRTDVFKALTVLPGISSSSTGSLGEPMAMIYVRGFNLRQVPLLIDGIPVYVPNDGSSDLSRILSFDLSEVNVSKGYTSLLYGPNAMGGAINLVSRKPAKELELSGATGWQTGGYRTNVNVGSNFGKYYIQVGAAKLYSDYFPLSKNFTPTKFEDGGNRDNSQRSDEKFNFKIGFTPKGRSEYALSYIYQHGSKGNPIYTGTDVKNSQYTNPRYWKRIYDDKHSVYFIANTQLDETQNVKTRLYYDYYGSLLNAYDDATYTTQNKPSSFLSYYLDYSLGGLTEYGKKLWDGRDLFKATLQYRQDVHKEYNAGQPQRTMSDETMTAGFENEFKIIPKLLLQSGFSFNYRNSLQAMNYNSGDNSITNFPKNNNNAYNVQGGLEYRMNGKNIFNLSVARKTRFATMKDRYSYRLGTALPNPNLTSEYTVNYEVGYKGNPVGRLNFETALFYSNINNTILTVNNVLYDSTTKVNLSQMQNVGRSEYVGAEIGLEYPFLEKFKAGVNYTYIEQHNLSNPTLHFTNVPNHKLFGYIQYQLTDKFYIQANAEYNSKRYSTSYGTTTGEFVVVNTKATIKLWKYFSVEGGVNNALDKNYATTEGFPEPGRNYFMNLVYRY